MELKTPAPRCPSCFLLVIGWTAVVVASVFWNLYLVHENTVERARIEARTIFEHNLAYRKWNTRHGGVYVKVDEKTKPNPYLDVEDRDLKTVNGFDLTMVNPFQMTREAYELLQEHMEQPTYNRTVSHDYLNPSNDPDEWESNALDSFEDGTEEISEVTKVNQSDYLRLLKPYIAMEGCVKCHEGYTPGDIRGGMSIAVSMAPYYRVESESRFTIMLTHFFLWLIGVFSIGMLTRNIQTQQVKLFGSEEKFRILAEFANDWEYWLSPEEEVVFMSPSCELVTGYLPDDFKKTPGLLEELVHPDDRGLYRDGMRSEQYASLQQSIEFRIITRDNETKWISLVWQPVIVHGEYAGKRVNSRDITEKKKLEMQLTQVQKMEAIGSLAGGIAHDFNNILTSIIGYSQILSLKLGKDENPLQEKAEAILTAGKRGSALTSQLLAFSRKQVLEMQVVDLNSHLLYVEDFLNRLIGEDVQLEISTDPKAGNIMADPVQLEQVIMNLVVNARDAMPDGGRILIETGETEIADGSTGGMKDIGPGSYAVLKVSDTGEGIPEEIRENIFEPFFTTKPSGKGTGLGLATVFGIVTQHKGTVQLKSSPGEGTTFIILLPKTEKAAGDTETGEPDAEALQKGTETLLVVDDDETICSLIKDTLEPLGYKVLKGLSGKEAMGLLRAHNKEVDLLLTDVVMPEMNGRELAFAAKLVKQDLKVLYMSGYTGNIIAKQGLLEKDENFIRKPLVPEKLALEIRKVLNGTQKN